MSVGKRIGKVLVSTIPLWIALGWQLLVSMIAMIICTAIVSAKAGQMGIQDTKGITQAALVLYGDWMGWVLLAVEATYILGFGLWFYFKCGKQKMTAESAKRIFSPTNLLLFLFLGEGLEFFINILLSYLSTVFPAAFNKYSELMDSLGLGENMLASFTAAFIGPVAEELIFRGIIFTYARKAMAGLPKKKAFWIANTIQAFAFGFFHLNLIQGIYAFCLGLIFGYVTQKYKSIVPAILLHIIFNGTSAFLWEAIVTNCPESDVFFIAAAAIGLVVSGVVLYIMGPIFGKKEKQM